ncbi:PAS domain-containing methyl-accepting chemotaxis protein [Thiomicrorhabdus sp.]|uniref:methyl-accepting chemotaxis protein n=1 Tax=Thiomicrorhabdus sp. TaxID=2039724 RepID=UPI0029C74928|nr:PAS domain-containing methyl-accepting chemotaxis protein [Thiomicrorhabdus sp.]
MAIIEFDLQGHILSANNNFLEAVGYRLEEIQGKHHRIFLSADDAGSSEYELFWKRLVQGEPVSGRFKRRKKHGQIIWLEASYNPVFDEQNRLSKFIKFATDITQKVEAELDAKAQIEAIRKVMAVIEFDPRGYILDANEMFIQTMGYSLDEIKGQHHKMFADPKYAMSEEYQKFWQGLGQGEAFSGTFQRFDKNGGDVWLEASYNPIFNAVGEVVKVIKYATDIGSNPNTQMLDQVILDASEVIESVSNGHLDQKMQPHKRSCATMYDKNIQLLSQGIKTMCHKLSGVIQNVDLSAGQFKDASRSIADHSESLSKLVQESTSRLQQTSELMKQTNQRIEKNSEDASDAAKIAGQVEMQSNQGVQVMNNTVHAMQAIQESSHKISEIVSLIDGIAFQTNLLALNAAVEAARAGEHGRGFAVVAGEVRALSQKSAQAAKDIKNLIEETVLRVNEGSTLADESGSMLNQINSSIQSVSDKIQQIARNSVSQAQETSQAYHDLAEVEHLMQQNAGLARESTESAQAMAKKADELKIEMAYFEY